MERVRFVTHRGKQVLLLDGTNCAAAELTDMFERCEEMVTAQPPNSVLTLGDFTGAQFTKEAVERMKLTAVMDRPHVKRAAIVSAGSLPDVYHKALASFSARDFPTFKTREEALDWLVQD